MLAIRREMDRSLAPYRRKMSADQLAQLERQYIQKRLYELFEVPRLSLFISRSHSARTPMPTMDVTIEKLIYGGGPRAS